MATRARVEITMDLHFGEEEVTEQKILKAFQTALGRYGGSSPTIRLIDFREVTENDNNNG